MCESASVSNGVILLYLFSDASSNAENSVATSAGMRFDTLFLLTSLLQWNPDLTSDNF